MSFDTFDTHCNFNYFVVLGYFFCTIVFGTNNWFRQSTLALQLVKNKSQSVSSSQPPSISVVSNVQVLIRCLVGFSAEGAVCMWVAEEQCCVLICQAVGGTLKHKHPAHYQNICQGFCWGRWDMSCIDGDREAVYWHHNGWNRREKIRSIVCVGNVLSCWAKVRAGHIGPMIWPNSQGKKYVLMDTISVS